MLFRKISERIYMLPADNDIYRPAVLAILGETKTLVVDAGANQEQVELIQSGLEELDRKADYLVLTHWHWDHSFGLVFWPEDTTSIAHEKTLGHLEEMSQLPWDDDALYGRMEREEESELSARLLKKAYPELEQIQIKLPDKYYASQENLDLGGFEVELHYLPSDHSDDNTLIYVPGEKFLYLGDVLSENILGESWYYTYHKLATVIDRLRQFDVELACESHGNPIGRIHFVDILNQLETVNEGVRTAIDRGNPDQAEEILEEEFNRPLTEEEQEMLRSFLYGYYL